MPNFLPVNGQLEAEIANATDSEQIREILKAHYQAAGIISRERGSDFGFSLLRQPQPERTDQRIPGPNYKFEKEIRFAESTGKRALLIRANTLEQLNELEAQILGY